MAPNQEIEMAASHYADSDPINQLPWNNTAGSAKRLIVIVLLACAVPVVVGLAYSFFY